MGHGPREQPIPAAVRLVVLAKPVPPVLAQGLQELESITSRTRFRGRYKRLLDQSAQAVDNVEVFCAHDAGNGLDGEAVGEDAQGSEERAICIGQQVVAPIDHRGEGSLTWLRGAAATGEQAETIIEPSGELRQRQRAQPRGRQLDGQWKPVEPSADLVDEGRVNVVPLESRHNGVGSRQE